MSDEQIPAEVEMKGLGDKVEALTKQLADVQAVIAERQQTEGNGSAVYDKDALAEALMEVVDKRLEAIQEKMAPPQRPNRWDEAGAVGPDGAHDPPANEYEFMLKGVQGKAYQQRAADLWLAKMFMENVSRKEPNLCAPPSPALSSVVGKLMTSTGVGTGDELVPTNLANFLWEDIFLASRVAGNLVQINMTSDPMPVSALGETTWRKGTAGQAGSATDLATSKVVFTTTEQLTEVNWDYQLDEDAIVAMMPTVRGNLIRSGAEQMDAFVLNADATVTATGNINSDDGLPAADSYYLTEGLDGIRHLWLVDNTGQGVDAGGNAIADADLRGALQKLGKYGVNPDQTVMFPEPKTYMSMLGLTNVTTVEKYGSGATILTGELMRYQGVPVVPSESQPLAEADGKVSVTPGNNTLGTISMINRAQWGVGFRRQLLIEVERDIQRRIWIMVVSFRIAVGCRGTRSSAIHTSGIYNILV
jgi:HK97 family phage major capsid protein